MKPGAVRGNRGPGEAPEARAEIVESLTALLASRGVPPEEIEAAVTEDRLDFLVIDQLLSPQSAARTGIEVVEAVGVPLEQADRLWRALGFADPHGSPPFNEDDVEALRTLQGLVDLGISSPETA
ncbi:MAG TPA: adenylate cyclase regulatory domain-containing protein, partial [Acidimicrobiales bacterium]|nr:adenylate cyclase regulatory domain-containing protein [Acidimicrobiales bacterium]